MQNLDKSRVCEQHKTIQQEFSQGTKFPCFDISQAIATFCHNFHIEFQPGVVEFQPALTDLSTFRLDVEHLLQQIEEGHQAHIGQNLRILGFSRDIDTLGVLAVIYPMVMCQEKLSNEDACKLIEVLIISEFLSRSTSHAEWNDVISSLPQWFTAPIDFEARGVLLRQLDEPPPFSMPSNTFDKELFEDMSIMSKYTTVQHIFMLAAFQGNGEYTTYCPSSGLTILNEYAANSYGNACHDEHVKLKFNGDELKVAQSIATGNCICSYGRLKDHNLVRMRVYKREKDAAITIYTKACRPYEDIRNVSKWTSEAVYLRSTWLLAVVWLALLLSFIWPIILEFACGGLLSARNIDAVGSIFASLAVAVALPQVLSSVFQLEGGWKDLLIGRYIPKDTKPFESCCKLCMLQKFIDDSNPVSVISGKNACFILGAAGHTKLHCEYTVGDLLCLGMNILECTTGNRRTFTTIDDPQACYAVETGYNWGCLQVTTRKSAQRGRFITFQNRNLPVRRH